MDWIKVCNKCMYRDKDTYCTVTRKQNKNKYRKWERQQIIWRNVLSGCNCLMRRLCLRFNGIVIKQVGTNYIQLDDSRIVGITLLLWRLAYRITMNSNPFLFISVLSCIVRGEASAFGFEWILFTANLVANVRGKLGHLLLSASLIK